MEYKFVAMNQKYAAEIVEWHYNGIYDFYDLDADEEDLAEFLDSTNWDHIFAVLNKNDELVGKFYYEFEDGIMWVGFGLRPDLTGKRRGEGFVSAGLKFGIDHYCYVGDRIMLAVAAFNQRAIRLYERLGFEQTERYMQKTNGGEYEFIKMQKVLTNGEY